MGTNTTKLGLLKPSENDFYNQQTEQADNWEKVDKFADDIQKNVDFNLLATLGIEYGGILNNTGAKVAGKAYYDTTGKKLYKCTVNTSINYADASYFEALSNNDLLGKLNNLNTRLDGDNTNNSQIVDCDNLFDNSGIPRFDEIITSSLNTPSYPGVCMTLSRDKGASGFQIFMRNGPGVTVPKMYVRAKNNGVITSWLSLV